jgi:nucleoside-diphosphate-sugar epimerase
VSEKAERRTVLVTGASGVVGQELVRRLSQNPGYETICLVHNRELKQAGISTVRGDITKPYLGMTAGDYRHLAHRVDDIINAAAVVAFGGSDEMFRVTNVEGTQRVVELATDADADFYHVSTAYVGARAIGSLGHSGARYAASKQAGEDVITASGRPHTILRPSIIVGSSRTGRISEFQGFYQMAALFFNGLLPVIPFGADARVDLIPVDVVCDAILGCLQNRVIGEEFWITNGQRALTVDQIVDIALQVSVDRGQVIARPEIVPPAVIEPLLRPGAMDQVPRAIRQQLTWVLSYFGAYITPDGVLPSSLGQMRHLGLGPAPDPSQTVDVSLRYWAACEAPAVIQLDRPTPVAALSSSRAG